MSAVILLACPVVLVLFADHTLGKDNLSCNKGIYINNMGKAVGEFTVTQDNCPFAWGKCVDCFEQCSNYTDVIFRVIDKDVSGLFNISWTISGDEGTYLMHYGIQRWDGTLQMFFAMLHFPETDLALVETFYTVRLQCVTTVFARVRITLLLPAGNRTRHFIQSSSIAKNLVTISAKDTVLSTVKDANLKSNEHQTDSVDDGILVAVVLGVLGAITLFLTVAVFCFRKGIRNKKRASGSTQEHVANNQPSQSYNQETVTHGIEITFDRNNENGRSYRDICGRQNGNTEFSLGGYKSGNYFSPTIQDNAISQHTDLKRESTEYYVESDNCLRQERDIVVRQSPNVGQIPEHFQKWLQEINAET